MAKAEDYIHEHKGRWVIAKKEGSTYYAPQRPDIRQLTGCHTTYGPLSYVAGDTYSYKRKSDALAHVRREYVVD